MRIPGTFVVCRANAADVALSGTAIPAARTSEAARRSSDSHTGASVCGRPGRVPGSRSLPPCRAMRACNLGVPKPLHGRTTLPHMTRLVRGGALLATIAVLPAGCRGAEAPPSGPSAGEAATAAAWEGPAPELESAGELPVAEFNAVAVSGEAAWTRSAFLSAAEYLRLDRAEAGRTSLVVRSPAEGGARATAVATLEGLPDDSVRALRFTLELERGTGGTWALVSALREQRCRPGRGHEDFDVGPCV